ncbi:MAG: sensor histidine kinase [Candidatus Ventricola sp.]
MKSRIHAGPSLSVKMVILFSSVMLLAMLALSSFAIERSISGANDFTSGRFQNMSASITRDIEQNIELMSLTIDDLTQNLSFMANLNQFVRDDSADGKVGIAARNAAEQHLVQSRILDNFYQVAFFTRDARCVTNQADAEHELKSGSRELAAIVDAIPYLADSDQSDATLILPPHSNFFCAPHGELVYSVLRRVQYFGRTIGYIEVSERCDTLKRILSFVDNDAIRVQVYFDDGTLFYTSSDELLPFDADIPAGAMLDWQSGERQIQVQHTVLTDLSLHLFVWQDAAVTGLQNRAIQENMLRLAFFVLIPGVIAIVLVSMFLTRSIRRLTKKVQQVQVSRVLQDDEGALSSLNTQVTSPIDRETYELERAFNQMMLHLRSSTMNELAMREGTLQAQLSALQTQINPHFIYNTLNIISAKAMESSNFDIIELCDQFASMLRYTTATNSRTATLQEEIENVRNYLQLAKARYEDNLEYAIDVPAELNGLTVPKLTLQPLVENALTHGYNGSNTLRRLSVTGRIESGELRLRIQDNGTGFTPEMLGNLSKRIEEIQLDRSFATDASTHIGLINTCLRLHYYSKGAMCMSIRNEDGAVVELTMPID